MRTLVSVNGRVSSPEAAVVPALDRGFLYGDSVYEVLWWHRGVLVQAREHFERLRESGRRIYLAIPDGDARWHAEVDPVIAASGCGRDDEVYVRLVVTRGVGPLGLAIGEGLAPTVVVVVAPAHRPTEDERRRGVSALCVDRLRNDARALDPAAKTGNYMNNLLALHEARARGGDDALLCNAAGDVTEATTSNVYVVTAGAVVTPPLSAGILEGTTRRRILASCRSARIPVAERAVRPDDLRRADEILLSSSVRGVIPVTRLDGRPVGDGVRGPVTERIHRMFEAAADAEAVEGASGPDGASDRGFAVG